MRKKSFTRQVGVLFSEVTYEELIRITDEIEISISEFIRRIIEENISQRKKEGNQNEVSINQSEYGFYQNLQFQNFLKKMMEEKVHH